MGNLNQKILSFSNSKLNQKVDRGECWDLAAKALKFAGAKVPMGRSANDPKLYTWSSRVKTLEEAIPGDIIQYNKYKIKASTEDGRWQEALIGEPYHTAILKEKHPNGSISVYEQNWENIKIVKINIHFIKPGKYQISKKEYEQLFGKKHQGESKSIGLEILKIGAGTVQFYRAEREGKSASLMHSTTFNQPNSLIISPNSKFKKDRRSLC